MISVAILSVKSQNDWTSLRLVNARMISCMYHRLTNMNMLFSEACEVNATTLEHSIEEQHE